MNERRLKNLVTQAFDEVQAPQNTTERVMDRIGREEIPTRPPQATRRVRYAVAAGLAAALVSTGAYAVTRSGLLESAFGNKGQDDVAATQVTGTYTGGAHKGEAFTEWRPGRTWQGSDDATVQRLVGDYVNGVDASTSVDGVTLTVESYVTDENGLSVATYALSGDADVSSWIQDAGYGSFYFSDDSPVAGVMVSAADGSGGSYAERDILDRTSTDGHTLHVVKYCGAWSGDSADGDVSWQLCRKESTGLGDGEDGYVPAGAPAHLVPAVKLSGADAADPQVSVSPLGVVITDPAASNPAELLVDSLVVAYADGTTYTVLDATTDNVAESYLRNDGSTALLFNALVDTDNLASVTLGYRLGGSDATRTVTLAPQ